MHLVDTHCHLTHEKFKDDIDAVIARAKKAGNYLLYNYNEII